METVEAYETMGFLKLDKESVFIYSSSSGM